MRRFPIILCVFLLAFLLPSCGLLSQAEEKIIRPGESIGGFKVEQGSPDLPYYHFRYFCDYLVDIKEPGRHSLDCDVPPLSGLVVEIGWLAKESKLSSNWESIDWELTIDGFPIALDEFDWFDSDYPVKLENNKFRRWLIDLVNLTPGSHQLRLVQNFKEPVDDGFNIYQPGRYEFEANFTVLDEPDYADFSPTAEAGQHAYHSDLAGLDFLFYLPDGYHSDPQRSWPLLVYLHGALYRGATLDLLLNEPLQRNLESDPDFPFVVASPIGEGGYEFWSDEKNITSLLALVDEINSQYAVDQDRIYLIGDGMGGNGVWHLGLDYPDRFAALVPIGGYLGYPFQVPDNICALKEVPVWAFHGGKDVNVPASVEQDLVDSLNLCGGDATLSIREDMTINILYDVYNDPALYEWLLAQTR